MSDAAEWFYARGNQQLGPITLEALRALAGNGQLTPADLVWCNGTPDWKPAGEVAELFGPAADAPAPPPPAGPAVVATGVAAAVAAGVAALTPAVAPAGFAGAAVAASTESGAYAYSGPRMDPTWDDREGASESEMPIPTYLVQSVLCTALSLMCGFIGLPFGVVAIVYAAKVGNRLAASDLDGARAASDTAKLWCRVSFWLTFAVGVVSLYAVFSGAVSPGRAMGSAGR